VIVDLKLEDGRITELRQESKACVLTQASASILGQSLKGATRANVETLREVVSGMLEGGPMPEAPFADYGVFDAALAYPNRHVCVLLPIAAVLAAFDASEAGEPESVRPER
jgi:NifU-like protein involved in Fe-S cluster formation